MYDTCFDKKPSALPRADCRILWTVRIVGTALIVLAGWAGAQMPNVPVLQNVWTMPGMVGAFNLGGGSGGSVYAAAASWTPAAGRFQFSGGLGAQMGAGAGAGLAYGVRLAMPMANPESNFGFGAFAGLGGGNAKRLKPDTTSTDTTTSTQVTQIPIGAAVGWRMGIGATRGFSVYASPSYVLLSGGGGTGGVLRTAVGADFGITPSIGITGGIEFGQTRSTGVGPSGTLYGLGVSYVFGRR